MNAIPLLLVAAAAMLPAIPAQKSQDQMIERRDKKLAKSFIKSAPWTLDYDKARATAKEQGKIVLTYFTRSYAP